MPDREPTRARRLGAILLIVGFVLVANPVPVSAHGSGGADATNYQAVVEDPGAPGLSWKVYGGDSLLELTNATGDVVVVAGYDGEPYLRFVPDDGVYRNTRSPATYLNASRYANGGVPADASPDAEPVWERVAGGSMFRWHDHRIHLMTPLLYPDLEAAPDREYRLLDFRIPVTIGPDSRHVEATGGLRWIPPVRWWPPVVLTGAAFAAIAIAAAVATRRRTPPWPRLTQPVIAIIAAVLAANAIRTGDDIAAVPATTGQNAIVITFTAAIIAVVGLLAVVAWRGTPRGILALAASGVLVTLLFGGEASAQLSASQLATVLPDWVRRWTIAASYTAALPCVIVAVVAARRYAQQLGQSAARPVGPQAVTAGAGTAPDT